MHGRCLAFVTVLGVLLAPRLHAQTPRRLSLADAVRLAQASSPLTQGARARVTGANARLHGAGIVPNPTLEVTSHVGSDTGGLDEDILLSQMVELGDKRRQRVFAARAERDATLAQSTQTGLDLLFNVQSAYYEALRADAERQQAVDDLATAQTFARAAETQFQAGEVARSNVIRSRIEVTRATQALAAAETERANRYDALRSLTGLAETTELLLTDTLSFAPVVYRLPDLQALALRNRPDLQAAQRLREAREADLHAARAASQPDLILEGRRRSLDPTQEGASLRFGVQFPLLDYGRSRADTQVAQTALREQQSIYDETLRTAQLEVRTTLRTLEQARQSVESFQAERLANAKELLNMAQIGYNRGATSYLELLDAQQIYRVEQEEYARALAAYNTDRAALQRAVGGVLP